MLDKREKERQEKIDHYWEVNGLLWKIRVSATKQLGWDTKEREQFDNQLESDIRKVEGDRQSCVPMLNEVLESFK
jgi:CRISPR/Cas system CSM-associated protein Csm2 small subunit